MQHGQHNGYTMTQGEVECLREQARQLATDLAQETDDEVAALTQTLNEAISFSSDSFLAHTVAPMIAVVSGEPLDKVVAVIRQTKI